MQFDKFVVNDNWWDLSLTVFEIGQNNPMNTQKTLQKLWVIDECHVECLIFSHC